MDLVARRAKMLDPPARVDTVAVSDKTKSHL
jgi:hypothetical protein